jgi:UDP-N-acetylglucosamine 2-epimerase (non-hydrolysing)
MKISTVLGTRPEIIRLSLIIRELDRFCDEHILIHTGQNFDERLSALFFSDLRVRKPDYVLDVDSSRFGVQAGQILDRVEKVFLDEKPDRLLVLGDTNSALATIVAKRLGIPTFHMEAGNRCYDDRVPEEVNRRLIDHASDVLMPYTERSRDNLLREGIPAHRIFVTGNPIFEVIEAHADKIAACTVLSDLELTSRGYLLVTLHRAENVDLPDRLSALMKGIARVAKSYNVPAIISSHPRLRSRMEGAEFTPDPSLRFLPPFGFFDFLKLEREALCVLSDSGTVQEECAIYGVPSVTLRDVTERPETLECGANILAGADPGDVQRAVAVALNKTAWSAPAEYRVPNVSDTVLRLVTGYHHSVARNSR